MRRIVLLLILPALCAVLITGCPASIEDEIYPLVDASHPKYEADRSVQYEQYLILMDGEERQAFFELQSPRERKRFLQEAGVVVKKMLNDNLRRGMPKGDVEKILGVPEQKQMEDYAHFSSSRYDRLVDEWWVYQETDSGNLVFLPFKRGWLVDWLVERKVRDLVFKKTDSDDAREAKQGALIHLQEEVPSLLRLPGEELEAYRERLKRVAPIVFSESPPRWPDEDLARKAVGQRMHTKMTKRDIYALWGKTAKIFELGLPRKPVLPYDKFSRWVYKVFNGRNFTYYSISFANDRLVDWEVSSGRS